MTTAFEFVREQLLKVGNNGLTQADLYIFYRDAEIAKKGKPTYQSFHNAFHVLVRLNWVVKMSRTEPSMTKYSWLTGVLADRAFYRISTVGRSVPESSWRNPYSVLYPKYAVIGAYSKYYVPTGRARGRPVRTRRRRAAQIITAEEVVIEQPAVVLAPSREVTPAVIPPQERPRRRLKIAASVVITNKLRELVPLVERIRDEPTVDDVDMLERSLSEIFDEALDAQERASGEEAEKLKELASRVERASEGFQEMQAGIERGGIEGVMVASERGGIRMRNRVLYLTGHEKVRTCCVGV